MALELTYYGHPALRSKGCRIDAITPDIHKLAQQMIETMYEYDGCGLAAQQIGRSLQMAVIDVSIAQNDRPSKAWIDGKRVELESLMPLVLINPEIIPVGKNISDGKEGCLSIPELYARVKRPTRVKIRYQSLNGTSSELEAEGLLARAAMHEVDHLNGILFIDHLPPHELQKHQPLLHNLLRKHGMR